MKTDRVPSKQIRLNPSALVSNQAAPSIPTTAAKSLVPNASGHAHRCDRWGHPCPGCVNSEASDGVQGRILADQTER